MDFSLNTEQMSLRDSVARYCRAHCGFDARKRSAALAGAPNGSHWQEFARYGWLGAALPEEWGGSGGTAVEDAIIMEEFGRSLVLEPFLHCAVLPGQLVHAAANDRKRRDLLPPLLSGELILAVALDASDAASTDRFKATAGPDAGDYVLNGSGALVVGGSRADKLIVPAATLEGPTLFVVDGRASGVKRSAFRTIDGLEAADVCLQDVRVAQSAVLGKIGAGEAALQSALEHTIVAMCAEAVGAMMGLLETTRDYLRQRRQYGAALSTYQALQHRMADMFAELELSRSILYAALQSMLGSGSDVRRKTVSAAMAYVGSCGKSLGESAIQLHGAVRMTDENKVGHYFRRLVVVAGSMGGADYHLERVARSG